MKYSSFRIHYRLVRFYTRYLKWCPIQRCDDFFKILTAKMREILRCMFPISFFQNVWLPIYLLQFTRLDRYCASALSSSRRSTIHKKHCVVLSPTCPFVCGYKLNYSPFTAAYGDKKQTDFPDEDSFSDNTQGSSRQ